MRQRRPVVYAPRLSFMALSFIVLSILAVGFFVYRLVSREIANDDAVRAEEERRSIIFRGEQAVERRRAEADFHNWAAERDAQHQEDLKKKDREQVLRVLDPDICRECFGRGLSGSGDDLRTCPSCRGSGLYRGR